MSNSSKVFGYCECFFARNIFLQVYQLHIHFFSKEQFLSDYKQTLISRGCKSESDFDEVLKEIELEVERRITYDKRSLERTNVIKQSYVPKYQDVYKLKEDFLDDRFLEIVKNFKSGQCQDIEAVPGLSGVFRIPVFKPSFCRRLLEELDHFRLSGMPHERPNTMNEAGILLGELGFDEDVLTPLREQFLRPLCSHLFPEWGGHCLDSHRGFTVDYTEDGEGGDFDLATHFDNAEVTLNVCLTEDFDGGELSFGQMRNEPQGKTKIVEHRRYTGILHRGQHMHGALPVDSGRRVNLIIWMRSSEYRDTHGCPRCSQPRAQCNIKPAAGFGDGFLLGIEESCSLS